MIYFSDAELDALLLEDIYRGDLTTRVLDIGQVPARIKFKRKHAGRVAGVSVAESLLKKLGLTVEVYEKDGTDVDAGTVLIEATGSGEQIHQAWKVVQVVMEWSCGVAQYVAEMVKNAETENPAAIIACTRKSVPGSRKLATAAVLAGGGRIHRAGASETVLVFSNHRALLEDPQDWQYQVDRFRLKSPENKVTIEADTLEEVEKILTASPDIIQLDKFSLPDVVNAKSLVESSGKPVMLSVAGGVNKNNIAEYAKTGVSLFITSAPYYAMPDDIKVIIEKNTD